MPFLIGCSSAGGRLGPVEVGSPPASAPKVVVARVNEREITAADLYRWVLERFGTKRMINLMIEEEIYRREADRLGITVSKEELDARAHEEWSGMAGEAGGEERLVERFREHGLSREDVIASLRRELGTQLLVEAVVRSRRRVTDVMLREYYRSTYERDRVRARHIVVRFLPGEDREKTLARAQKLWRDVRSGGDFASVAREESEEPATAHRGGDLGMMRDDSPIDPAIRDALFALAPGEVGEPVEQPDYGYHILQVTEKIPKRSLGECLDVMREEIARRPPEIEEVEQASIELRNRSAIEIAEPRGQEDGL